MSRTKDRTYLRNRRKILNQDVCWLCGQWIDPDLKYPHDKAWTADHVIPIHQGGSNAGELRPAHNDCNKKRHSRKPQAARHTRVW